MIEAHFFPKMSFLARSQNMGVLERCQSSFCKGNVEGLWEQAQLLCALSHLRGWCYSIFLQCPVYYWIPGPHFVPRLPVKTSWIWVGFSLKLVEVCQGWKWKKDTSVFVVRKFSGKRMVLSLSLWSTAGLRRFPVAGLPAGFTTLSLITCAGSKFLSQSWLGDRVP